MRGGSSQDRRRARRAAGRRTAAAVGANLAETFDIDDLADVSALAATVEPEAAVEPAAFAESVCSGCSHSFSDHVGASGPCTYEDGRGSCSCSGYMAASEETGLLPETLALSRFDEVFPTLFTSGDVAWTHGEGAFDLLADITSEVGPLHPKGVLALDVSVGLDKVLLAADGQQFVAHLTIDGDGNPVIADETSWTPVEKPSQALTGRMRLTLAELAFADVQDVVLPKEHQPGATLPDPNPSPAAPPTTARPGGSLAWEAVFLPEAELTDDGRSFAPGSVSWRELPLSLMAMTETSAAGGHDGAEVAGRIDKIWRDGNLIRASGVFDGGEFGQEIARMVGDGVLRGLSVDTAISGFEYGPRSDFFDADGNWIEKPPEERKEVSPLDVILGEEDADDPMVFVVREAVIGMATVCPFPAFARANISLQASAAIWRHTGQAGFIVTEGDPEPIVASGFGDVAAGDTVVLDPPEEDAEPLTASAAGFAPIRPPAEWFEDPELDELTPLTVDDDGRIYGHAWSWDTCHLAFPDQCVLAPRSATENAFFHLGEIECEDGETFSVGRITLDTGHAGPRLSRAQAAAHYDDTGTVAAHVRVGEDTHGGWISGAISPELSEEKLRLLRGAVLSGDWRAVRQADGTSNLELVALLAVNVPGFPVPRQPKASVVASGGELQSMSLVAAGIVTEQSAEEQALADVQALALAALGDCVDCGKE